MALFCPTCSNMLLIRENIGMQQLYCRTCPYMFRIREKVTRKQVLTQRKPEAPITDEQELEGAKAQVVCPACSHTEALFHQIQIRSGDEPMTSFYFCVSCRFRWKEN
eukprot:Selendium_serpulae@DN304_c0_g1_i3.p1